MTSNTRLLIRVDVPCFAGPLMPTVDGYALHFGPYRTSRYTLGAKVECQARGEVTIVGTTDARIPWPIGQPLPRFSVLLSFMPAILLAGA